MYNCKFLQTSIKLWYFIIKPFFISSYQTLVQFGICLVRSLSPTPRPPEDKHKKQKITVIASNRQGQPCDQCFPPQCHGISPWLLWIKKSWDTEKTITVSDSRVIKDEWMNWGSFADLTPMERQQAHTNKHTSARFRSTSQLYTHSSHQKRTCKILTELIWQHNTHCTNTIKSSNLMEDRVC